MGRDAKSVVRLTADERAVPDALVKHRVWRGRRCGERGGPTGPHCKPKSPLGSRLAMLRGGRPTGRSPHRTPESNSRDSNQPANPSYKN